MTNTPKVLLNELDQAPKTGKSYKDTLNDHDLRNQIIKAFDSFNNEKTKSLFNEWKMNPEAFYKKHLSPEDYSVLNSLCVQKINLYTAGINKPQVMSFSWRDIFPVFNDRMKIGGLSIDFPNSNISLSKSPVEEQIKLIELLNKLSIKKINNAPLRNNIVFGGELLFDERFKDIHEINGDLTIRLNDLQEKQKIFQITQRLNDGDLHVTGRIDFIEPNDKALSILKNFKKVPGDIYVYTQKMYDVCEEITGDLHTARDIKYPSLKKIGGNLIFNWSWNSSDDYDDEREKEKSLSKFPNLEEVDGDLDVNGDNNMIDDISDVDKLRYVGGDLKLGREVSFSFESELRKRIKEGKLKVEGTIYMNLGQYRYIDGELRTPVYYSHDSPPAYEIS